jgi:hypothetical protein
MLEKNRVISAPETRYSCNQRLFTTQLQNRYLVSKDNKPEGSDKEHHFLEENLEPSETLSSAHFIQKTYEVKVSGLLKQIYSPTKRKEQVYSRLMGQVDIFSKMKEHICSLSKTNNESLLQLETLKIRYSNMCVCYCFLYLCFSLFSRYLRFAQCQNTYTKTYTLYWAKTVNIHISL